MCHDCALRVEDEVEASIKEAKQECAGYEAAIARLAQENLEPLTDQVLLCCCTTFNLHLLFAGDHCFA